MLGVSPYVSELKSNGKIESTSHRGSNLVKVSDIGIVYDRVPDKHKTEYSNQKIEEMLNEEVGHHYKQTSLFNKIPQSEQPEQTLEEKVDRLNKKLDKVIDILDEIKSFAEPMEVSFGYEPEDENLKDDGFGLLRKIRNMF